LKAYTKFAGVITPALTHSIIQQVKGIRIGKRINFIKV